MTTFETFTLNGWVRVVKSGIWQSQPYKVGEIMQYIKPDSTQAIDCKNSKGRIIRLSVESDNTYGVECEFIGMEEPLKELNYQIY